VLHPTYQHLEDRIRLAGLSLLQWAQLFVCALGAFGLSKLLPLPGSWSLSLAITVCGMPAAAAIAFMQADFDVRRWLLDALRFGRAAKRYLPGDGGRSCGGGYLIAVNETAAVGASAPPPGERLDLETLWRPA
jgi:hypothetical protein